MRRNTGFFAAIAIAVAAIFGFSVKPSPSGGGSSSSGGAGQTATTKQTAPKYPAGNLLAPCLEIQKRITKFLPPTSPAPKSCADDTEKAPTLSGAQLLQKPKIRFILATLPDPVHTHFPLLFDRLTEALQQAAQDQGYNYDGSWLPWSDETRQYGGLSDQQKADALQESQEQQPGVLVFRKVFPPGLAWRQGNTGDANESASKAATPSKATVAEKATSKPATSVKTGDANESVNKAATQDTCDAEKTDSELFPGPYNEGLIVFVVGENPTGGIDHEQFDNALQWMAALGAKDPDPKCEPKLRILGPYFSGSLPSLAQALVSNHLIKVSDTTGAQSRAAENSPRPGQKPQKGSDRKSEDQASSATSAAAQQLRKESAKSTDASKPIAIFSGSVSSKTGIDWFNGILQKSGRFYSFQENDDVMIDRYCRYLSNNLHYDTGKLAIISEDETAYGVFPSSQQMGASGGGSQQQSGGGLSKWLPDCDYQRPSEEDPTRMEAHGPLYLYYPRDIASLRSAYEQEAGGTSQATKAGGTGLPVDLGEPSSRQRDTIRNYGGKQTPLSQESTLFGITNLLKTHHIHFIVLRSSNTLDQVFLTRFLAQSYPDARVVLTNADLLFRRSGETTGFRGTMTLTTYPLLTWQQDWTYYRRPESRHSHRAFPQDSAEGLYLATRFLILANYRELSGDATKENKENKENQDALSLGNSSSVVIQDYAPPYWLLPKPPSSKPPAPEKLMATRPPTWLSVVGNGQLWPVAVLDEETLTVKQREESSTGVSRANGNPPIQPPTSTLPYAATGVEYGPAQFTFPFSMFVCCALILAWGGWHFFCCSFGSHNSSIMFWKWCLSGTSVRSLAYFARVPRPQHKWLVFIGCTIMGLLAILVATMTGIFLGGAAPLEHRWQVTMYCAGLFVLSWAALVYNYRTYIPAKWMMKTSATGGKDEKKTESVAKEQQAGIDQRQLDVPRMIRGGVLFLMVGSVLAFTLNQFLIGPLSEPNSVFAIWRSINPFIGVSPLVPLVLLSVGLYGWFWYSLSGVALFNAGRSKLPMKKDLPLGMPMFSRDLAGKGIERSTIPLNRNYGLHFLLILVPCVAFWCLSGDDTAVRNLGPKMFGRVYFFWTGLLIVLTLTEAWQMLRTWGNLRQLLIYLDRLPLRRTLQALKGYSWGTVWKMSGNVLIGRRDLLISRQIESLRHLQNEVNRYREAHPKTAAAAFDGEVDKEISSTKVATLRDQFEDCDDQCRRVRVWFAKNYECCLQRPTQLHGESSPTDDQRPTQLHGESSPTDDLGTLLHFQEHLAATAGVVLKRILIPQWRRETKSQILDFSADKAGGAEMEPKDGTGSPPTSGAHPIADLEPHIRAAEEFVCLPYLGFIQNILGRIRTMTLSMTILFIACALSVASYPFDPRPVLGGTFLAVFLVISAVAIMVYGEMHRDATLSHITKTNPGELGLDFWVKLFAFGFGPLIALLTAMFPQIAGFVTSWLQPTVGAIK